MTFQSRPPSGRQLETASAITRVAVIRIGLILCLCFAMPFTESEEEGNASQSPSMTTPMKISRNSGAGHGEPDTATESEEEDPTWSSNAIRPRASRVKFPAGWNMKSRKPGTQGQRALLKGQISTIRF